VCLLTFVFTFPRTDQTIVYTVANHKEVPKVPKAVKEELGTRK